MTAPMAGFGPMAWSPLSGGGSSTPPVTNTTTTTFEGGPWTFTKDAGAAETIMTLSVADEASSYLRFQNWTTTAGQFSPEIYGVVDGTLPGLVLSSYSNQDSGALPSILITAYTIGPVRPLLQFYNGGGTPIIEVDGVGTCNFVKPAETGVAETITQWGVADSALRLVLKNLPTADTEFVPCFIWPNNGAGTPTFTTRSTGNRTIYRDTLDGTTVDFAIGYTTDTLWYSVGRATSAYRHSWYGGEDRVMSLTGDGSLSVGFSGTLTPITGYRDVGAGDSSNIVQAKIGNSGTDEGEIVVRFTNGAAAGGTMAGGLLFFPRNNADTSNFQGGGLTWVKNAGGNTADMDLVTGSARIYAEGGTGDIGIGTTSPLVTLDVNGPVGFKSYTVATLPSAATKAGQGVYVSDASGSPCLAISNGTNWKRCDDMTVTVS